MNPEIFREYDIRGLNEELDNKTVTIIGKAYGTIIASKGGKKVAVGRDNREQSPRIAKALIEGIASTGIDITFVGEVTTPELYYAVHKLDLGGGINVTGSHNPPKYNGFKILVGKEAIHGKAIQEIREIAEKLGNSTGKNKGTAASKKTAGKKTKAAGKKQDLGSGQVDEKNIDDIYLQEIASRVSVKRKLRVVVDAGNGMASELGPRLLRIIGCEVIELYCKKDSTFPNHIPDPSVQKNMEPLEKKVVSEKADFGMGFDGDCDRIGVVDEKGHLIYGDRLLGMLAKKTLSQKPGAKIIFEVKCSQGLGEYITSLGGNPIMWKTGHSLIKAKMREEDAALAGEMSGHMFFAFGWFGFDDALLAAAKVVEIVSESNKKISELAAEMPQYASSPEYRIDCPDSEKFSFVEKAKSHFGKSYKVIDVDGARVLFKNGWALLRASNTQPKLILRIEGRMQSDLEAIKKEFLAEIKKFSGKEIKLEGNSD